MFWIIFESKVLRPNFSQHCPNVAKICFFVMSGHCNLFRPRGVKITCFEYLCIENFMTQLFTRLYKDYESYFSRNERSLQSIYAFASPNSMLLRIFVSGVFTTQLFTISYKHYQICFFSMKDRSNLFEPGSVQITCF